MYLLGRKRGSANTPSKSVQILINNNGILRGSGRLSYQPGVSDFSTGISLEIPLISVTNNLWSFLDAFNLSLGLSSATK